MDEKELDNHVEVVLRHIVYHFKDITIKYKGMKDYDLLMQKLNTRLNKYYHDHCVKL